MGLAIIVENFFAKVLTYCNFAHIEGSNVPVNPPPTRIPTMKPSPFPSQKPTGGESYLVRVRLANGQTDSNVTYTSLLQGPSWSPTCRSPSVSPLPPPPSSSPSSKPTSSKHVLFWTEKPSFYLNSPILSQNLCK